MRTLAIYNSKKNQFYPGAAFFGNIIYYVNSLDVNSNLSRVHPQYFNFNFNVSLFTEAQFYNTYFNRKVAVDRHGQIKRALHDPETFGNILSCDLLEIINSKDFKRYSNVTKDKIKVCRDCELRYACVDQRIPIKSNNVWVHENECNYNPYTNSFQVA
jgi:radical SAM protein with 4Fe4S-binding SPASM domain